jgi:hypothetical protein
MSKRYEHPIITPDVAREQGMSANLIRVIANGLDRRADVYHAYADTLTDKRDEYDLRNQATANRVSATQLRRMAVRV